MAPARRDNPGPQRKHQRDEQPFLRRESPLAEVAGERLAADAALSGPGDFFDRLGGRTESLRLGTGGHAGGGHGQQEGAPLSAPGAN